VRRAGSSAVAGSAVSALGSEPAGRAAVRDSSGASPAPAAATAATTAPTAAPLLRLHRRSLPAEIAKLPTVVLAEGTWKGENDKYQLTLTAQAGGFPV